MTTPFTVEQIPTIRHYMTEEEYQELLDSEAGFDAFEFLRRCWVLFQSINIYLWAYRGIQHYRKVQNEFTRVQVVFCMQLIIVTYVLINEFIYGSLTGIFLMLAFAHFVNFLTFTLVVDSCQTEEMDRKKSAGRLCNTAFRLLMRLSQIGFICIAIWGPSKCTNELYPWPFLALIWTIVAHNLYDLFLFKKNYFVKLDKMPPMSANQLRFNKDLFQAQTKCLLIINVIFGTVSIFLVVMSYLYIQEGDGISILCYEDISWAALNIVGTLFIGAHQLLIMMQIKMSQQVLIKIPASMGLFQQNIARYATFKNVRSRLLTTLDHHASTGADEDAKKLA